MTHLLLLAIILMAAGMYFITPAERTRLLQFLRVALWEARDAILLAGVPADDFFEALRARTRRAILTFALLALSAVATVLSWSAGPGDGGWRHLALGAFIHAHLFGAIVDGICLLQVGLILERLLGRLAFAAVYLAGGFAVALVTFAIAPDAVSPGATGSVVAMYGVLVATSVWSLIRTSPLTLPASVAKRLAPVAGAFVMYHLVMADLAPAAALAALLSGLAGGVAIAMNIGERTPPFRPLVRTLAGIIILVMVYAALAMHRPTVQTTDVRPEIQRVIAVEHRTTGVYDQAVGRFRKGRINATALADLIQQTIVPEVQALTARMHALQDVPPEDEPLVKTVEEFLKLRDESWRMRAEALVKGDSVALRQADKKQQDSLETFKRMTALRLIGG